MANPLTDPKSGTWAPNRFGPDSTPLPAPQNRPEENVQHDPSNKNGRVEATGATAGTPGAWTPGGSRPPNTVADLIAGKPKTVTANPATAWTSGQYVQTGTAGTAGRAHWAGSAWVAGAKP